jgi:hypothetical protein
MILWGDNNIGGMEVGNYNDARAEGPLPGTHLIGHEEEHFQIMFPYGRYKLQFRTHLSLHSAEARLSISIL